MIEVIIGIKSSSPSVASIKFLNEESTSCPLNITLLVQDLIIAAARPIVSRCCDKMFLMLFGDLPLSSVNILRRTPLTVSVESFKQSKKYLNVLILKKFSLRYDFLSDL